MVVSVEGDAEIVPLTSPLVEARSPAPPPCFREYQLDGSDTTNNFTFDPDYFSRIADSPYYRFQAFLRDEGSYSQWRNLSVGLPDGRVLTEIPLLEEGIALPESFVLSAQLRRLETPRTLNLIDESGAVYGIEIDRNDRYVQVTRSSAREPETVVARRFFPNRWEPFAVEVAYMASRVAAVGLFMLLVVTLLAGALFRIGGARPKCSVPGSAGAGIISRAFMMIVRPRFGLMVERLLPAACALFTLAAGSYVSVALFDRSPHVLDAVSYYFQAKTLASGHLALPAPPIPGAFPVPFTIVHDGKWFSQYPPGTAGLLAVGFLAQVPWLVEPVLAAVTTWLISWIGLRQYGRGVALLAGALAASSPFVWLMAGSFMSHVPSTFFAALFLVAATRYAEKPSRRWLVLGTMALGCALFVREATALLYAGTVGVWLAWGRLRRSRRAALGDLVSVAAVGAPFLVAYVLYNQALTGVPWIPPRLLFSPVENRFGFGDGMGFYGRHTVAAGLVNADEQLTDLAIVLFGWPFYFSLAAMAEPFILAGLGQMLRPLLRVVGRANRVRPLGGATDGVAAPPRLERWDVAHGAVVLSFILVYVGFYYHGIVFGPRYYYDALPAMVLLAASGFASTARWAGWLLRRARRRSPHGEVVTATLALVVALVACNALYFAPREMELYRGFTGLPGGKGPGLGDFVRVDMAGRRVEPADVVITTDDWWIYSVYLAPLISSRAEDRPVLAFAPTAEDEELLLSIYTGRDWYRVVLGDDGKLRLDYAGVSASSWGGPAR